MKKNSIFNAAGWSWYLLLIPLFWALHGFVQHYPLVQSADVVSWGLFYTGTGILLTGIAWLYLRNGAKSAVWAGMLLIVELFFGPFHDFLKSLSDTIFLVKYSFLLPAGAAVLLFAAWKLKKYTGSLRKVTVYLNVLFLVLILLDGARFLFRPGTAQTEQASLQPGNNTNEKPDVYLLVADGYPGRVQLEGSLGFSNARFEQALQERGFICVDSSRANYNFTQFSVASLLTMNYLRGIKGINSDGRDISISYEAIKNSAVIRFFTGQGYRFFNCSVFDFPGQPSRAKTSFLFRHEKPLRATTLSYRIRRDLAYHLVTTLRLPGVIRNWRMGELRNNEKLTGQTLATLRDTTRSPKFVYTHLNMPHYPYYFDSTGKSVPYDVLSDNYGKDTSAFLSYLKYSNNRLLALVDSILLHSKRPPLILLISDHGFREYPYPVDPAITFYNLMALHIPGADPSDWPAGMTNVNLFRTLLRTRWGLDLPNLPDSTFVTRD